MYKLYQFLLKYRAFIFFILIQLLCWWMIFQYNNIQNSVFFSTSNRYAGALLETRTNITDYFHLKEVNEQLAKENAKLRKQLSFSEEAQDLVSMGTPNYLMANRLEFIPAKVVKNSVDMRQNYLTLNKGTASGVKRDMGVISPLGIVGRVIKTSSHFSTAISLLHQNNSIASKIKRKNIRGTVSWPGGNPTIAKLEDVLRHHNISEGDTIITSEDNSIFPEGVIIGTIKDYHLGQGSSEYDITIDLATDFTALSYVYIIGNKLKPERDSLENITVNEE